MLITHYVEFHKGSTYDILFFQPVERDYIRACSFNELGSQFAQGTRMTLVLDANTPIDFFGCTKNDTCFGDVLYVWIDNNMIGFNKFQGRARYDLDSYEIKDGYIFLRYSSSTMEHSIVGGLSGMDYSVVEGSFL